MSNPLNTEARLAAVEAELAEIKRRLGILPEARPPVIAEHKPAQNYEPGPVVGTKALEASATDPSDEVGLLKAEIPLKREHL